MPSSQGSQARNTVVTQQGSVAVLWNNSDYSLSVMLAPPREAVVVVEDEDGADHAAGHHDHDAGEVSPNYRSLAARGLDVTNLYNQCHC